MNASPLWTPSDSSIQASNLTKFAHAVGVQPPDFSAMHRWSIDHRPEFWKHVWSFTEIRGDCGLRTVIDPHLFPGARWFPDARLNFAENLLRYKDERQALVSIDESGERTAMSFAELAEKTARFANHLRNQGVGPGDTVAAWLPNVSEAVVGMLGTASLGAVWTSVSPDFGVAAVVDRLGQIHPKVLLACNRYRYNGREFNIRRKVEQVQQAVPSIRSMVWLEDSERCSFARIWGEQPRSIDCPQLPFNHPLYILYSSGTTGKPKCIVHGAGGSLIQHLKEHQLHVDLRRGDCVLFFTTTGWMMWNWLVSALASGSAVVLFDGSPFHPHPGRLIDLIDSEGITVFGAGAKYFASIQREGLAPIETHDLASLRTILSTGSPLSQESFRYCYRSFKPDAQLASISGGTDLISCFVLGNPWQPVFEGEIQGPGLGMDVDVVDDGCNSIDDAKGELVCRKSFPSTPLRFVNDPDDRKFRGAYFDRFEATWAHGDFCERVSRTGGYVIHGRSDAVLNPGGVRIGTAEIYRQVETIPEIVDCVCVGQDWQGDTRVILFVVVEPETRLDSELVARIRMRIRENATPRHVPSKVLEVPDVPRTRSGKIAELAVRDVIHGRAAVNTAALSNPESLDAYANLEELTS